MEPWWITLLREQQSDVFRDLAGADAWVTLPISDRLITRVIAAGLPASSPVREFELLAHPGDIVVIRVRLAKPSFFPLSQARLAIVGQPELPRRPRLVIALQPSAVSSLVASALRFVDVLPAGVRFADGQFVVDVADLLERQHQAWILDYLTDLKITTLEGRVVVQARAGLPGRR